MTNEEFNNRLIKIIDGAEDKTIAEKIAKPQTIFTEADNMVKHLEIFAQNVRINPDKMAIVIKKDEITAAASDGRGNAIKIVKRGAGKPPWKRIF